MLERRAAMAALVADRGDLLVVPGLGSTTWDLAAAGDDPRNFYLWGAMGGAAMIGLGLALAQPKKRVLVITGDGEMLMGMGALATAGAKRLPNLAIAIMDNGRFGETGQQHSHTALGTDLAGVAAACGWAATATATDMEGVAALRPRLRREPLFAVIRISSTEVPRYLPPRDGARLTSRFRDALGVTE